MKQDDLHARIEQRIGDLEQYAERLRIEFERVQGALTELRALLSPPETPAESGKEK